MCFKVYQGLYVIRRNLAPSLRGHMKKLVFLSLVKSSSILLLSTVDVASYITYSKSRKNTVQSNKVYPKTLRRCI